MARPSSPDTVREHILRIMGQDVDATGHGPWMTMRELLEARRMKANQVHRRLYELWQSGIISARTNPAGRGKYVSQQYRIVPGGASTPLYIETPARSARELAACFGGYTYLQSNHASEAAWQA